MKSMMGTSTNHKIVAVRKVSNDIHISCKFIDIRCYLACVTLDRFAQDFGNSLDRVKNFFPYEFVTMENYKTELYETEPFLKESLHSSLSNTNI